jgi:hypothetical protein
MMHNVIGYYVVAARDDGTRWYMAIDQNSGGYEYFTTGAGSAALYPSLEEAHKQVERRMGVTFLHNASGADYAHPVRTVRIAAEVVTSVEEGTAKEYTFRMGPS